MAKIRITPITESGIDPFELNGQLTHYFMEGEEYYCMQGMSLPAEIVTILEE